MKYIFYVLYYRWQWCCQILLPCNKEHTTLMLILRFLYTLSSFVFWGPLGDYYQYLKSLQDFAFSCELFSNLATSCIHNFHIVCVYVMTQAIYSKTQ